MRRIYLTTGFVVIFWITAFSQPATSIKEAQVKTDILTVTLQFNAPHIVRVIKTKKDEPYQTQNNFSIIAEPREIIVKKTAGENIISFDTDSICVEVDRKTGTVRFSKKNRLLISEDPAVQPMFANRIGNDGYYKTKQGFVLEKEEPIYGLGQHQKGTMNQRNQVQLLYQNNMEIALPVFQSIKGYGILWNNEAPTLFADTLDQTYFLSDKGKAIDYFFIWGGNTDKVVAGIRQLSGQSPLLPKWAFGFIQSKERYQSQRELLEVVKKYRQLGVPLDCIVQDWRYWGMDFNDWNALQFNNPAFDAPQKMVDSVHAMNSKIIISVWPSFGPNTAIYKALDKEGFIYRDRIPDFPKEGRVYNAFNSKARDMVWEKINKNLFALGMDGWWLDATEPFEKYDFKKFSNATYLQQLQPLIKATPDTVVSVPNSYPLYAVSAVAENQRATQSDKRTFILTRSGYIGQQRFGTAIWSGDITSSWQAMKNQISAGLNIGLSGIPYWNADIGGFWSKRFYPQGHIDPAFRELVVRWIQFGTFTALMRLHGTDTPREIYQFGEKGHWAYDAIKKYIDLRYRLLPYTYATSYQVMKSHASLMRPLFADFGTDKATHNINDQFLYGQSILVAPVTESQYVDTSTVERKTNFQSIQSRMVYLPKGSSWFDFWTGEKLNGGQQVKKQTSIDIIPIYVRAGAILPLGDFKQYTAEKNDEVLEIRIYAGANGKFTLYEDEGDNYNYEKGRCSTIDFSWNNKSKKLSISSVKGTYTGALTNRVFNLVLVGSQKGTGINPSTAYNKKINYQGKAMVINL